MAIGPSLVSPPWGCGQAKMGWGAMQGAGEGASESRRKAKSDGEQRGRGRVGGARFDQGFVWSNAETTMGVKTHRFFPMEAIALSHRPTEFWRHGVPMWKTPDIEEAKNFGGKWEAYESDDEP
jgi:hypothetical protein